MPKPIEIDYIANDKGVVTTTDKIIKSQKNLKSSFLDSMKFAGGFSAVVVAGVGAVTSAYKDYLELAKDKPELFTPEQLESAEALAASTSDLKDSFERLKIATLSDGADGLASAMDGLASAMDYSVTETDLER